MKFRIKSLLIIKDFLRLFQEMTLIKAQRNEIPVIYFMLNQVYDPVAHPDKFPGIMDKGKGNLNEFAEGEAKKEKPEMDGSS